MCVCTHVLCPRPDNFKSSNKLSKTTTKASRTRKTILSFNLVTYTYIPPTEQSTTGVIVSVRGQIELYDPFNIQLVKVIEAHL